MIITIDDLRFNAIIGILDFERITPQEIVVTCKIEYTYAKNYINYAEVATCITNATINEKFLLLEEALLHVSTLLKKEFPLIETLFLSYSKPTILDNCIVSVSETYRYT